jgi:sugar lactone lactonase YvrE
VQVGRCPLLYRADPLGEGIRWDARRDEMLAVDILAGRIYRGRVRDDDALERVRIYQLPGRSG